MKKISVNWKKICCLVGMGVVMVGCQKKQENPYQNKSIEVCSDFTETITTLPNVVVEETHTTMNVESMTTSVPITTESVTTATTIQQPTTSMVTTNEDRTTYSDVATEEYIMSDAEVIDYIQKLGDKINDCTDSITDTIKKDFIRVVDFLFYGGTIGGRTLDSLTESAKEIVFNAYDTIHTYIESKWPSWRDFISGKYESGKQKIKGWYEKFRDKNQ